MPQRAMDGGVAFIYGLNVTRRYGVYLWLVSRKEPWKAVRASLQDEPGNDAAAFTH